MKTIKVHNCIDCPLTFVSIGNKVLRRVCNDGMCDMMMNNPTPIEIEFIKSIHMDVDYNVEPLKELVNIWRKNTN